MNKVFKLAAAAVVVTGLGFAVKEGLEKQREIDTVNCEKTPAVCPNRSGFVGETAGGANIPQADKNAVKAIIQGWQPQ